VLILTFLLAALLAFAAF